MILITGAAGFIGSNLAVDCAKSDAELVLVDHTLSRANVSNFAGLKSFHFVDAKLLLDRLQTDDFKPSAIYHLGACSATTETNWSYLLDNNIRYTQALWHVAALLQIPFIYASSAATYGDGSQGFDDRTPPDALKPLNLYGKSKNDFDIWSLQQVARGELVPPVWAGCKFFNVYGPRELHKGRMASVVLQAFQQIRSVGTVKLFRSTESGMIDGGHQRDFVFVQDCIDHMKFLATGKAPNGIYNSGTGTPRRFLDLAHSVFAALGESPKIEFIDMPADLVGKYQSYTKAEMSKLREAGFTQPPTTLEEGAKQTVNWLKEHAS